MDFKPVKEIRPRKKMDVIGVLNDILNSPYDTVMINENVILRYSTPEQCRSVFSTSIKRKNLESKLKVYMRSGKIYICKIKED